MYDFFRELLDTQDFTPRATCGNWSPGLIWLHRGSDLFIWLAYVSIPLVLLFFAWRRRTLPFRHFFWLFAAFILACGLTHFFDAMMFHWPVYRLAGLVKLVTAAVSWLTVVCLVPAMPQLLAYAERLSVSQAPPARHPAGDRPRSLDYIIAILAALSGILIRGSLDQFVTTGPVLIIPFLGVIFVAWLSGFWPCLVTLSLSMAGVIFLFVPPYQSFVVEGLSAQIDVAMFFFGGVGCALLGESQRQSRLKAETALHDSLARQSELQAEVARRTEIEERLRASEERFRTLAEAVPQIVWVTRPDGYHEYFNPKWYEYTGLTPQQSIGFGWSNPLHPDDRERARQQRWKHSTDTGEPYEIEYRFRGKDDQYRWFLGRALPQHEERGRIVRWFGTCTDIEDAKRSEQRLRQAEEEFRTLADNISQFAWMTDENGWIFWYNQRWFDYTGTTIEQMKGWGWQNVQHPDHVGRVVEKFSRHIRTGEPWEDTFPLRGKDGQYRRFLSHALPIRDESGKVVRWFGTNTDVEDQKRLEEDLRQALERSHLLMEAMPALVWTSAPSGEVTYFNRRYEEYTGVTLADGPDGWTMTVHSDDLPGLRENWAEAVRTGLPTTFEYRIRQHSDGEYRWHLSYAAPLSNEAGEVVLWVGAITDIDAQRRHAETLDQLVSERTAKLREEIAERVKAEKTVEAVATELRRSNGELEQFAYVASHDLQEPLRKIRAFGDRLVARSREQIDEQGRDYIDRMQNSAARMQQLIDDLLTYSRVSTRGQQFRDVDLGQVAREVVSDLEGRILQTGGEVRVGQTAVTRADPTQMRQLLQNLIGNALKFHRPDVPPVVEVSAREVDSPDGPAMEVRVSDNGIGFDEQYLDRIFQVFQRLHGRGVYEGTGVGLAICKKIVERHGGTITATSRPGEGATFAVVLPRDPTAHALVSSDPTRTGNDAEQ